MSNIKYSCYYNWSYSSDVLSEEGHHRHPKNMCLGSRIKLEFDLLSNVDTLGVETLQTVASSKSGSSYYDTGFLRRVDRRARVVLSDSSNVVTVSVVVEDSEALTEGGGQSLSSSCSIVFSSEDKVVLANDA